MTQFVNCVFKEGDKRAYAYQNDGEPLAIGDRVIVENKSGEKTVIVSGIIDVAPPYQCKAVLRKAPPKVPEITEDFLDDVDGKAFDEAAESLRA